MNFLNSKKYRPGYCDIDGFCYIRHEDGIANGILNDQC